LETINEIKEVISHAEKKEFSKFADKVKTSLEDKLRNNPKIKDGAEELMKMQRMKDAFAQAGDTASPQSPQNIQDEPGIDD